MQIISKQIYLTHRQDPKYTTSPSQGGPESDYPKGMPIARTPLTISPSISIGYRSL